MDCDYHNILVHECDQVSFESAYAIPQRYTRLLPIDIALVSVFSIGNNLHFHTVLAFSDILRGVSLI